MGRTRGLVVPERLLSEIRDRVGAAHPREAGGYLVCTRRPTLTAVEHVPLENEADDPLRRFESTVPDAPEMPRVFYHSHTSPASISGLTRLDSRISERFVLVVFAPRGEPHSYRLFRRGVFNWRELPVSFDSEPADDEPARLPRLA